MRILISLFFLLCCFGATAQNFKFPALAAQGKTVKSLTPPQWKVIDSVYGDLNHDGTEDLALIFEFYAAIKENRAYGDNTTELITEIQRPRMLSIYFKSGRKYKLITQNNDFILRSEEGGPAGDPLRPMSIADHKLNFVFEGGGNWRWKLNYSFSYQDSDWRLTNARNYAYQTGSGEMNDKQYDFVKRKRKAVIGKMDDRSNQKIRENSLKINDLRTFSSFKKPWTWEIGSDEYL